LTWTYASNGGVRRQPHALLSALVPPPPPSTDIRARLIARIRSPTCKSCGVTPGDRRSVPDRHCRHHGHPCEGLCIRHKIAVMSNRAGHRLGGWWCEEEVEKERLPAVAVSACCRMLREPSPPWRSIALRRAPAGLPCSRRGTRAVFAT